MSSETLNVSGQKLLREKKKSNLNLIRNQEDAR